MKTSIFLSIIAILCFILLGCKKEEAEKSERFILLTSIIWTSETLEANGIDASAPGEFLDNFVGDANFNEDGTGNLGNVTGTWYFTNNETQLVIITAELPIPVTTNIVELSETRLEITTIFPSVTGSVSIRMVYVPK